MSIHITNFDSVFAGRKFKDKSLGMQSDLICIGYASNEGSPFFIGSYVDANTDSTFVKTVLMKNAEFIP